MLITGTLLKRAMKGDLPLMQAGMKIMEEVMSFPSFDEEEETFLSKEKKIVSNCKKAGLMVAGVAVQKYMQKLTDEQELISSIADVIMEVYAMESTLLRTLKFAENNGEDKAKYQEAATKVFINDAVMRVEASCKNVLAAIAEGDNLRIYMSALRRYVKNMPINTIELRREIADMAIEQEAYIF